MKVCVVGTNRGENSATDGFTFGMGTLVTKNSLPAVNLTLSGKALEILGNSSQKLHEYRHQAAGNLPNVTNDSDA